MRIILLGLPGAGKGTQSQQLQAKLAVPLIVMGDILREAIDRKTPIGVQAEQYVSKGALVPDNVVIQIVLARLNESDCSHKGFLLDGFPRTLDQAQALDTDLTGKKIKLDYALYYAIPDEVAVERLSGRMICKACKAIYHLQNNPPRKNGVCDACGNVLAQRKDDTLEVIKQRLQSYHKETAPLLNYYRQQNILVEIPSNRPPQQIFEDTLRQLKITQ